MQAKRKKVFPFTIFFYKLLKWAKHTLFFLPIVIITLFLVNFALFGGLSDKLFSKNLR